MRRVFAAVVVAIVAVSAASALPLTSRLFRNKEAESLENARLGDVFRGEWKYEGHASKDEEHEIVFAIRHKNSAEIEELLYKVSDPDHELYTQYLSFREIGERFSNGEALWEVLSWLSKHELGSIDRTLNGEFVTVRGTVAQLEKLLGGTARFHRLRNVVNANVVFRTSTFELPLAVADSVDFVGRTNQLPSSTPPPTAFAQVVGASNPGDVYPAVLTKYYGIEGVTSPNPRSSQAVFEALGQNYSPTDLATFEKTYGIASDKVDQVIGPNTPLTCLFQPNSCVEASLDVQYMLAVATGINITYWSIPGTDQTPFLDWSIAVANSTLPPLVHSISYGGPEHEEDFDSAVRFNQEVQKLGLRGVSVLVASGDDGVANFPARTDPSKCGFVPAFPASCSAVTSVGATMGPENGQPEVVCQSDKGGQITSGGGFSGYFKRPSYQDDLVQAYLNANVSLPPLSMFNSTGNAYPTVAALGHSYEIEINSQTLVGSGTSASTPVFAGMISLVNDARLAAGKQPLGYLNPALFKIDASVYNDITSGENNCAAGPNPDCCQYGFTAAAGYDPITGRGSPKFAAFKAALLAL